jgi:hypothetical protein
MWPSRPPVLSKTDFTQRYQALEFGNRTNTWHDRVAFESGANQMGSYHLRNRVAAGATYYDQSYSAVRGLWLRMSDPQDWYCSEMAPTATTVLQGEVMQSNRGLYLLYSTLPMPMRPALATRSAEVYGIIATSLLRTTLDPGDYDWLMELLDTYEDHVVEFSHYRVHCGVLQRRMIVWEVRSY